MNIRRAWQSLWTDPPQPVAVPPAPPQSDPLDSALRALAAIASDSQAIGDERRREYLENDYNVKAREPTALAVG